METDAPQPDVIRCPHCGRGNRVPAAAAGAPSCGACHEPLPWLVHATDADFQRVADASDLPVLVDLWATWCPPCHAIAPHVARAAETFAGRLKVVKVDVDRAPGIGSRFQARSIPTLLVLDHGATIARQVGAIGGAQLDRWIEGALAARAGTERAG
ncbi:MAG: redoxin domain-containing protein [Candidatus Dormibacteraeota bacterium]|nr:redoxin domain-containing protein [Candidatus Dormibacteraeota bacterium]